MRDSLSRTGPFHVYTRTAHRFLKFLKAREEFDKNQKWVVKIGVILNSGRTKNFFHLGVWVRVRVCYSKMTRPSVRGLKIAYTKDL